jgi:hypothetical protein
VLLLIYAAAHAAEVNVDAAALEAARDGDDPKSEIITLIMTQVAAAVPSKDSLTELKAMSVRQLRGKCLLEASMATLIILGRVLHVYTCTSLCLSVHITKLLHDWPHCACVVSP